MRKFILFIFFALTFLSFTPVYANAPKLFVPVESYDFGEIAQGQTVEYSFIIKNTGKAPLEIIAATPDCDCTKVKLSINRIKAGRQGEIIVAFNSKGQNGAVTKLVIIETNDPVEPIKMIKIKGMIVKKDA